MIYTNMKQRVYLISFFPGVAHVDDIGYLFHVELLDLDISPSSQEYKTMQRFVKMWTNFAKTG